MTGEQQRNVFRMAAIIYGRSNNGISLNKSYQRVIDDALYSCGRLYIPITELIVYINKEYGFLFSVDEINNVVIKGRDADQRYYCYTENNDTIVSLTGEYKNKLSFLISYSLDFFIVYGKLIQDKADNKYDKRRKQPR